MKDFIEGKKKELLLYMVEDLIPSPLYEDKDYDECLDFVTAQFIKKPSLLLSFFSISTFQLIKGILDNSLDLTFDKGVFLFEDYSILIYLGIVDYDTLSINEKYNEVLRDMIKLPDLELTLYRNTLLKGLIDLYGYIEIPTLKSIYLYNIISDLDPDKFQLDKMVETSGLIEPFVHIDDDVIYRNEIGDHLNSFIRHRDEQFPNKNLYRRYTVDEVLYFEGKFTFADNVDYLKNPDCCKLFMDRAFFMMDDPSVKIKDHKLTKESLNIIKQFNEINPKWFLGGNTLDEYKQALKENQDHETDKESNIS